MSVAAELEAALGDAEPEVRRLAVRRLVEAAAEGPALLVRALADSDWRVRKEAAQTAARLPARADLVARLYAALADRERVGLRNAAVEALASLGPDVVAPGVLALDRLDADGRKLVVEVLAVVPDPRGVVALASVLRDPDPNVRAAAAEALAQATESEDDMAVVTPCLLDALADRDAGTRLAALRSLAALGVDVELERLAPHVADPLTRRAALAALGASSSPGALSLLAQSMGDAPLADAGAAAIALAAAVVGALDAGAKVDGYAAELARRPRIHERLRGFAASEDAELRGAALLLLALGRNPDDVQLIVDALGDDEVAERAELALQLFGDEVVSPLVSAAMSAPPEVRSTSLSMLPHTDVAADPEALSGLRAAARDPSSDVACAALRSLAHVGTEADVALVAELTLGPDSRSVQGARIALRELGGRFPEVARAFVVEEVARPRHPLASCTLLEVLASRGAAPPAAAHLARAATHDDALVRRAARRSRRSAGRRRSRPPRSRSPTRSPRSSSRRCGPSAASARRPRSPISSPRAGRRASSPRRCARSRTPTPRAPSRPRGRCCATPTRRWRAPRSRPSRPRATASTPRRCSRRSATPTPRW
jgi:HEAT repeat protein